MLHSIDSWLTVRNLLFILIFIGFIEFGELTKAIHALEAKVDALKGEIEDLANPMEYENTLAGIAEQIEMEKLQANYKQRKGQPGGTVDEAGRETQ